MQTRELPDHAHDFLASLGVERGLSRHTIVAYHSDLAQYAETLRVIDDAGDEEAAIHRHLVRLVEFGLSESSIARKFASIRSYYRYLVTEGIRENDPSAAIGVPTRGSSLPKALTVEEVAAVIAAPGDTTPLACRDTAMLEFLYATGCRVSELTATDLHDVDLETRTVIVTGKGNKQRLVPLGSYAVDAIARWLPHRMDLRRPGVDPGALLLTVRGNRMSRQSVWRSVKQHGTAAGIDPERLSPHVFRHSAATHMVEGGADLRTVQEILGHASLSTTQTYTRVSPEHLREVLLTSHPRAR
ncbi:MAG: tyrosine recombinase [Acidimicrobiia bacterium]